MQPGQAAETLSKAIAIAPDEALYERKAINLDQAGQQIQAIKTYDQADAKYGWSEERSDSKVDLYIAQGKDKEALEEVKKWSDKYPDNVTYIVKLARYLEYRGDAKKAIRAYEKALKVDPYNEEALFKTSQANSSKSNSGSELSLIINNPRLGIDNKIKALLPSLTDKNGAEEVLPYGKSLVDQYPEDAKSYALYGDILWLSGDTNGAVQQYEQSLKLKKSVYQVWDQLMMGLAELNKVEQLEQVSNDAIDYYPNQAGPYYYQAVALLSNNKAEDAMEMNDEALFISDASSGYITNHALILKATILDIQGSSEEAINFIEGINEEDTSPGLLELLGDLYKKAEDKPSAEKAWKRALEKGGNKERINVKIQSI